MHRYMDSNGKGSDVLWRGMRMGVHRLTRRIASVDIAVREEINGCSYRFLAGLVETAVSYGSNRAIELDRNCKKMTQFVEAE